MPKVQIFAVVARALGIAFSIAVFLLSVAPFTPAVFMTLGLLPLAVVVLLSGSRKTGLAIVFWSVAAIIASPMNQVLPFDSGLLFLPLLIAGLVLMGALYFADGSARRESEAQVAESDSGTLPG